MLIHDRDYRLPGRASRQMRCVVVTRRSSSPVTASCGTVPSHTMVMTAVQFGSLLKLKSGERTIEKNVESRTRVRDAADITLRLWTMTLGAEVC